MELFPEQEASLQVQLVSPAALPELVEFLQGLLLALQEMELAQALVQLEQFLLVAAQLILFPELLGPVLEFLPKAQKAVSLLVPAVVFPLSELLEQVLEFLPLAVFLQAPAQVQLEQENFLPAQAVRRELVLEQAAQLKLLALVLVPV
jgi:hypothetical protein